MEGASGGASGDKTVEAPPLEGRSFRGIKQWRRGAYSAGEELQQWRGGIKQWRGGASGE